LVSTELLLPKESSRDQDKLYLQQLFIQKKKKLYFENI